MYQIYLFWLCFNRKQEHIRPLEEQFSPVNIHTQGVLNVAPQQHPVFFKGIALYFLEDFFGVLGIIISIIKYLCLIIICHIITKVTRNKLVC